MKKKLRELIGSQENHCEESEIQKEEEGSPEIPSEEETSILLSEAGETLSEIDGRHIEIQRVEDLVDGLEDLAEIAEGIESASMKDLLLIETATRLAIAGSDIKVDEVVPGLEGFEHASISMEKLKDTARRLWEGIKKALTRAWEAVVSFFKKTLSAVPRLRIQVDWLRRRAEESTGKDLINKETSLGGEANALTRDYRPPKGEKDIIDGVAQLKNQSKVIYSQYLDSVKSAGNAMANSIRNFDPTTPEASLDEVCTGSRMLDIFAIAKQTHARPVSDRRFEKDAEVYVSQPLPGNKSIFFAQDVKAARTVLGEAESLRRRRVQLMKTREQTKEATREATIVTITPLGVLQLCDLVDEVCSQIENYWNGQKQNAVEKAKGKMESASESLSKTMSSVPDSDSNALTHYRSAVNFNSSFSRWSTQPQAALASQALSTCRAVVTACNKSLSNYE